VLKLRGQRQTPKLKPELKKLSRAFLPQNEAVYERESTKLFRMLARLRIFVNAFNAHDRPNNFNMRPPNIPTAAKSDAALG
jgi:hypothetical protein